MTEHGSPRDPGRRFSVPRPLPDGGSRSTTARPSPSSARVAQAFYGRYAELYDLIATRLPLVGDLRARAADALDLSAGDTVVEFGCGTGANLPYLRERVGPDGLVVGVDFTPEVLAIARDRVRENGWGNVEIVRGDATAPPIHRADAALASFVTGMFPSPADTVEEWLGLLDAGERSGERDGGRSGGRLALLDAAPSRGPGAPLNPGFRAIATVGSPPGTGSSHDVPVERVLGRRVGAAHDRLRQRARPRVVERPLLGFVWLTAAAVPAGGGDPVRES